MARTFSGLASGGMSWLPGPRPGLVDDRVARYVGADAWVRDAAQAIPICSRVLGSPPLDT